MPSIRRAPYPATCAISLRTISLQQRFAKKKVRECSAYVGIFGFDYGTPVRDRPDISYTELEFLTAIKQRADGRMRVFVFLLDENARLPGVGPVDLRYISTDCY